MESVRGVNVPMYTTLRRTTVVFTMIVEYLLTGQKYTSSVVGRYVFFSYYFLVNACSLMPLKTNWSVVGALNLQDIFSFVWLCLSLWLFFLLSLIYIFFPLLECWDANSLSNMWDMCTKLVNIWFTCDILVYYTTKLIALVGNLVM